MEQHPVPQNVTTFQFRLIGDMTLKQFGYLAGGAILAYVSYKLPLPLFLNWPLAIIFALGGFGFAFVPIEERPMDVWVLSFFKSIYSPTQYVWTKNQPQQQVPEALPPQAAQTQTQPATGTATNPIMSTPAKQDLASPGRRGDILSTIFSPLTAPSSTPPQKNAVPTKSKGPFDWLFDALMPRPRTANVAPAPAPTPHQVSFPSTVPVKMDFTPPPTVRARDEAIAETSKKEVAVQEKVADLKKELEKKSLAESQVLDLQKQMADLVAERNKMEAEIARLKLQSAPPVAPKPSGTYVATPVAKRGPSVRIITPDRAVKAGLPRLTTFPNVITGIIKDGDQNLLPGVLVTVKDKDGVPVRALKTNRLGQFASSTPLINGTYYIEIEDPRLRFTFDRAQITLNGSVVPALEVFAKSQKEITRAKLEKELFGDKPS